jgi:YegS/Rv2252/BmrU family lipid kinase
MSIAIIINPISGARGRALAAGARVELARRVAAACGETADVSVTEQAGHARDLARTARAGGARLVVAWGGDGTVNEVASALAFGDVPLAIVPGGSGNGLAHELGVSADPTAALTAALRATPRSIDAGEVDGRLFVNVAGIGFDAHVAARFNSPDNRRRGLAGYALLTARSLAAYTPGRYDIVTADARLTVCALLVVLANGTEFGNRIRIAPHARVDDGALDLVIVEQRSRLGTVWNMRRLLGGSVDRAPIWSSRRVERVVIGSDAPMTFHVDGEPIHGGTSIEARVHAGALRICA